MTKDTKTMWRCFACAGLAVLLVMATAILAPKPQAIILEEGAPAYQEPNDFIEWWANLNTAHAAVNVVLEWDYGAGQPSGDLDYYYLEQSELTGSTWSDWHTIQTPIDKAAVEYSVNGLLDGTYRWRLVAVDTENPPLATASNQVQRSVEDTSGPPTAPTLNIRVVTIAQITIRGGEIVASTSTTTIERDPAPN